MHNEIRGIPGEFDRTIATVKGLKALGMTNLRLAFTTNEKNINHLSKVYNLAQELEVIYQLLCPKFGILFWRQAKY